MTVAHGTGRIVRTIGELLAARLPAARIGDGVRVHGAAGALRGKVVAVDGLRVVIAPLGGVAGVAAGDRVESDAGALSAVLGFGALGRAFDALGATLDGGPAVLGTRERVADAPARSARCPVVAPFWTGVCALDGLLTIGRGARVGFFGAPGAGKTTLLEWIARRAHADAVVVALVGERGREAAAWCRGVDARRTVVCATADRPAAERVRAADVAMAQAGVLAGRGMHVLVLLDSLARYATALRELRAPLGEPVGRGGFPPSVLAALGRYLERAGAFASGSITLVATVLSDGADERDPVSDAARAALDGHVVLSPELARAGRFPAIDALASASRTMHDVTSVEHRADAAAVRAALALLADTRDLRALGLASGDDPALARAVATEDAVAAFLTERAPCEPRATLEALARVAARLRA